MQSPILEQLAQEYSEDHLKIAKLNVDENPNTPFNFNIMSIPTLMFKKNGQVVKKIIGVHTKIQLQEIIQQLS